MARSRIWLAPLAGVSTRSFRAWHIKMGVGLVHTEMVSAVGLCLGGRKTQELLSGTDEGVPVVVQLFSPDAEYASRAAELVINRSSYAAIEINMACPMPKITKRGCGAALIGRPDEAERIVKTLKDTGLPVWVKTRIPDRASSMTAEAFIDRLISSGADLVILHGRTEAQRYEGIADKGAVIRAAVDFPGMISASGDVFSPDDADHYLSQGCVSVLVARGAIRDAYIVPRIYASMGSDVSRRYLEPSMSERAADLLEIGRSCAKLESEAHSAVLAKRMVGGIFRDHRGSGALRQVLANMKSWHAMDEYITSIIEGGSLDTM